MRQIVKFVYIVKLDVCMTTQYGVHEVIYMTTANSNLYEETYKFASAHIFDRDFKLYPNTF